MVGADRAFDIGDRLEEPGRGAAASSEPERIEGGEAGRQPGAGVRSSTASY